MKINAQLAISELAEIIKKWNKSEKHSFNHLHEGRRKEHFLNFLFWRRNGKRIFKEKLFEYVQYVDRTVQIYCIQLSQKILNSCIRYIKYSNSSSVSAYSFQHLDEIIYLICSSLRSSSVKIQKSWILSNSCSSWSKFL